jgi:hypothetical protein
MERVNNESREVEERRGGGEQRKRGDKVYRRPRTFLSREDFKVRSPTWRCRAEFDLYVPESSTIFSKTPLLVDSIITVRYSTIITGSLHYISSWSLAVAVFRVYRTPATLLRGQPYVSYTDAVSHISMHHDST